MVYCICIIDLVVFTVESFAASDINVVLFLDTCYKVIHFFI
jgi:hypothetical protein